MFSLFNPFSLKALAAASLIALVIGFGSGVWVRDAFCDSAQAKAEVANLKKQVAAFQAAARVDASLAKAAADRIDKLEQRVRDAESKISDGVCLPPDDTDRLRNLWKR